MDPQDAVEVYSTLSPSEAEIIRLMLDGEGIAADVAGDTQGGFPGALPEVSVLVLANDADRARDLISQHQLSASNTSDHEES